MPESRCSECNNRLHETNDTGICLRCADVRRYREADERQDIANGKAPVSPLECFLSYLTSITKTGGFMHKGIDYTGYDSLCRLYPDLDGKSLIRAYTIGFADRAQ